MNLKPPLTSPQPGGHLDPMRGKARERLCQNKTKAFRPLWVKGERIVASL